MITFSNGYKYVPWDDREDDNTKIWHDIVRSDGTTFSIDWSPYSHMTVAQLERWVALGEPARIGYSPLSEQDLAFLEWLNENKNDETLNDKFRQCAEDIFYTQGLEISFEYWAYDHFLLSYHGNS